MSDSCPFFYKTWNITELKMVPIYFKFKEKNEIKKTCENPS